MKSDATIKKDVLDELNWEPSIDATKVGVTVENGIVSLSGHVRSYAEKVAAEKASRRVAGVKALVDEIDVKLGTAYKRTDQDIAQSALNSLKWNTNVPHEKIQLKVEDGWITLEGDIDWNFQREAARNYIKNLAGVRGVTNLLKVKAVAQPESIKHQIRSAFERNALIDADRVNVRIDGHKVFLSGVVQSLAERKQAERAAWSAPGVTEVEDNLMIKISEPAY